MPAGFYVTVRRPRFVGGVRQVLTGWLLGPYDDEPTARAAIPEARRLAREIDPFTDFDAFGTARLERDDLPAGLLNARLEN